MNKKYSLVSLIAFLSLFVSVLCISAQTTTILTNTDIVSMVKARLSLAVIKAKIKFENTNFDTSVSGIQQLKKLGVTETIIHSMIEKQGGQPTKGQVSTNASSQTSGGTLLQSPVTPHTSTSLSPKRVGIPRIGIVTTTTTAPLEQDEAIRAQFYEVLYGNRETSTSEAILMKEKLDRNILSEAAYTKTDYLLFISLDSTIESAVQKQGNFLQKGVQAAAQGLGAVSKLTNPLAMLTGITYKSYQMADSLQTSAVLLSTITNVTKKNDKIGINFKLVRVGTNEVLIAQTLKEINATKKREPILQNLLIQLGNEIINAIPYPTTFTQRKL